MALFTEEDAHKVLKLKTSPRVDDSYVWAYFQRMEFTIQGVGLNCYKRSQSSIYKVIRLYLR